MNAVRISVGLEEENHRLLRAMHALLQRHARS
jgi:histidinol-phosphate/aromatic aminotransferase/cobyric acid decarboxylase-like protein